MLQLFRPKRRPVAVAVRTPKLLTACGEFSGRVWQTDVKFFRAGEPTRVFTDILFVEGAQMVYIAGLELESNLSAGLDASSAARQHEFIEFLHTESSLDQAALGTLARTFQGYEYGCVGKVTAAFLAALGEPLDMGIGFWNQETGGYALFAISPLDGDYLEKAKRALPFEKLGLKAA